jgi:hypothetical protein
VKDDSIKDNCKTEEWNNAVVLLLFENYVDSAISVFSMSDDAENEHVCLRKNILNEFVITKKKDDFVLVSEVCEILDDCKKKINNELINMGVSKEKCQKNIYCNKLCYFGLKKKI